MLKCSKVYLAITTFFSREDTYLTWRQKLLQKIKTIVSLMKEEKELLHQISQCCAKQNKPVEFFCTLPKHIKEL